MAERVARAVLDEGQPARCFASHSLVLDEAVVGIARLDDRLALAVECGPVRATLQLDRDEARELALRLVEATQLDAAAPDRLQRLVLQALLDPPAYGRYVRDLARTLREPEADVEAAAGALEDKGLARLRDGYPAATGAAMEFDALWPGAV